MAEKGKAKGKVIQFTPRERPKLKKLDYVDPAQKQLRKERERKRHNSLTRNKVVRNVGIFIGICVVAYLVKNFM